MFTHTICLSVCLFLFVSFCSWSLSQTSNCLSAEGKADRGEHTKVCSRSPGQRCYVGPILHHYTPTGKTIKYSRVYCNQRWHSVSFILNNLIVVWVWVKHHMLHYDLVTINLYILKWHCHFINICTEWNDSIQTKKVII